MLKRGLRSPRVLTLLSAPHLEERPRMPRAVLCRALGPPEDLVLAELPRRALAAGEARVAIAASGINFPDTLTILGKYQHKPPLPFIPGVESAGTIIEIAPDAGAWRVG